MSPRIVHDRAWRGYNDGESVVTRCTSCGPAWQSIAFSEEAARRSGEGHLERVHDVAPARARNARALAAARRS